MITLSQGDASEWLLDLVSRMSNGWLVHFSSDEEMGLPDAVVRVSPAQLVIGLANAWAFDSQKDSAVAGVLCVGAVGLHLV